MRFENNTIYQKNNPHSIGRLPKRDWYSFIGVISLGLPIFFALSERTFSSGKPLPDDFPPFANVFGYDRTVDFHWTGSLDAQRCSVFKRYC